MSGIEIISTAAKLAGDRYTMDLGSPDNKKIINIIETFLKDKKLICYGGTAINNILPKKDQFYTGTEFPDYDFYSKNAIGDAKQLANIYFKNGFKNILAKSGMHYGTYKVFVNYIPVADITQINSRLYKKLSETAYVRNGMYYCPPDYLRMNMYLELSRPKGDVSRWEKVYSRLKLLDNNYPIKTNDCDIRSVNSLKYFDKIVECFASNKCIFFGGKALQLYSKYNKKLMNSRTIIDVFHMDPEKCIKNLKKIIPELRFTKDEGISEIFPPNYIITINSETVAIIYEPIACYSFINITNNSKTYRVASVFTLLSMYLLFTYMDKCKLYNTNRIMCIADIIISINDKNFGKGVFKELPIECYGDMHTLPKMLEKKSEMFNKLKNKKNSKEYEEWFLKYDPYENSISKLKTNNKTKHRSFKKKKSKHKSKTKSKSKSTRRMNKRGGGKYKCYYIHSPTCGYCSEFNPMWDELVEKYNDKYDMNKVDIIEAPGHITTGSVPHIVIEKQNQLLIPFEQDRTKQNLIKFLNTHQ